MTKNEIIKSLIDLLESVPYRDKEKLENFKSLADLKLKGLHGKTNEYRYNLKLIRFAPWSYSANEEEYKKSWDQGKSSVLKILYDIQENPQITTSSETREISLRPVSESAAIRIIPGGEAEVDFNDTLIEQIEFQKDKPLKEIQMDVKPSQSFPCPKIFFLQNILKAGRKIKVKIQAFLKDTDSHINKGTIVEEILPPHSSIAEGNDRSIINAEVSNKSENPIFEDKQTPEDSLREEPAQFKKNSVIQTPPLKEPLRANDKALTTLEKIEEPLSPAEIPAVSLENVEKKILEPELSPTQEQPKQPSESSDNKTQPPQKQPKVNEPSPDQDITLQGTPPQTRVLEPENISQTEPPSVSVDADANPQDSSLQETAADVSNFPQVIEPSPVESTVMETVQEVIPSDSSFDLRNLRAQQEVIAQQIFLLHGEDEGMRTKVAECLQKLGLEVIFLKSKAHAGKPILQKLTEFPNVKFCVALLSSEGYYFSKDQKPKDAKLIARPNHIFETAYLIGKLGRNKVFILYTEKKSFELPSLFFDAYYIPYDEGRIWQKELIKALQEHGYPIAGKKF